MTAPLVRFAPSPTGFLHVGNMRTALVNWLFARREGGRFLLRLDDTDAERSRPEFAAAIEEDMRWLGLEWDGFCRQSDRLESYETARRKLVASGRLYPCYETQEELDFRRKLQAGRGLPPIYDRAALKLADAQRAEFEAQGRRPHYRFLLEDKPIAWDDLVRGEVKFPAGHVSDPVLVRADGVPLYTLASVVDDGEMGVTHVIRGEDHVSNTAVQVQIFEALGYSAPRFAHLALIKTREGELSKRVGGNDIRALRQAGIEPLALTSLLARIGTSHAVEVADSLQALVETFDFGAFSRAPATYDPQELERLNAKRLAHLPYAAVQGRVEGGEAFWLAVRGNLHALAEADDWLAVVQGDLPPQPGVDKAVIQAALANLPAEPWDGKSWGVLTQSVAAATGLKGKALFLPLRLALTGREHGPEMSALFPLIGKTKIEQRLRRNI